jgi:F-type H+-transporting ATPase subunit delta
VIERTLARRYAAALLRVTGPEGSTDEAEALLQALQDAYEKDPSFRAVLAQPRIPRKMKKALFRRALEGRALPSFLQFLDLLVDKNRLDLFPVLAEAFGQLADESRGLARVQVRSWRPLSEAHRQRLEGQIARLTGKRVTVQSETDPRLRGGMLVRLGNTVMDGSVARRLKLAREHLGLQGN